MIPRLEKSIALLGEEKKRRKSLSYVPLGQTPPEAAEGPRKNNALRKKWSERYMAKENRSKGALLRKIHLGRSLSPKGYMDKATKTRGNTAKPE